MGPGPGQVWQGGEPEPLPPMDEHLHNNMAMQVSQDNVCTQTNVFPRDLTEYECVFQTDINNSHSCFFMESFAKMFTGHPGETALGLRYGGFYS